MPRLRWCAAVAALSCGCSSARYAGPETGAPGIVLPAHFAEGSTGKSELADGGAPPAAGGAGAGAPSAPPDPEPLSTRVQWEYSFRYSRGKVEVTAVRRVELDHPVPTDRRIGRFAVELWVGAELLDRVRFDFPLLGADAPPPVKGTHHPLKDSPRFGPGAETTQRVAVPASDRATSARLIDRLTGNATSLPWPPSVAMPVAAASATAAPAPPPPLPVH